MWKLMRILFWLNCWRKVKKIRCLRKDLFFEATRLDLCRKHIKMCQRIAILPSFLLKVRFIVKDEMNKIRRSVLKDFETFMGLKLSLILESVATLFISRFFLCRLKTTFPNKSMQFICVRLQFVLLKLNNLSWF